MASQLLSNLTNIVGWVSGRDFLLGFAILSAVPGPNFNFAVFLGVLSVPSNPALGAVLGYIGIFTPGIALKLALLPLYKTWRTHGVARSTLRGLNAAASGLVYTAVWQLFLGKLHGLTSVAAYLDSRRHLPASWCGWLHSGIVNVRPLVGCHSGLRICSVALFRGTASL